MNRVAVGGLLGSGGTVLYLRPELLAQLKSPLSLTSPYEADIREIQQLVCYNFSIFLRQLHANTIRDSLVVTFRRLLSHFILLSYVCS